MRIFDQGSTWLRADFHLHTKADKEFKLDSDPNYFVRDFIAALKAEDVRVAAITNHNKFDTAEYREIQKNAQKEEICVLPGVELSVAEGASGVHCLVIFDPNAWLDGTDYINKLLDHAFGIHIKDRENENARCTLNLEALLKDLKIQQGHGRDSFVVMAHAEDRSGFLKELNGGRIKEISSDPNFREFVLGFQKCRTRDLLNNAKEWIGYLPALVEGSDPKNLQEVGKPHQQNGNPCKTYVKLGAFSFASLQYALRAHNLRLRAKIPIHTRPHVKSMTVTSGTNTPLVVRFNASLNTSIGIRGSGKSTLIEILRYALDVRADSKAQDSEYKKHLLEAHLGSGGKVSLEVESAGNTYTVDRVLNDARPKVRMEGTIIPNLLPSGIINVAYFGQKDLAQIGQAQTGRSILERFFPDATKGADSKVKELNAEAEAKVREKEALERAVADKAEVEEEKATLENKAATYKKSKVTDKLTRQVEFNRDRAHLEAVEDWLESYQANLSELVTMESASLAELEEYTSKENADIVEATKKILAERKMTLSTLEAELIATGAALNSVSRTSEKLQERREALEDEFAEIRRKIDIPEINADSVLKDQQRLDVVTKALGELEKKQNALNERTNELLMILDSLQSAWHAQFEALNTAINEVNQKDLPIDLTLEYRGDRDVFVRYLKRLVEGTGIKGRTLEQIAEKFPDPIEIYRDLIADESETEKFFGSPQAWGNFFERVTANLAEFLSFRVPDVLTMLYKGTPLERHSLGQRASALILFLLGRSDHDLLIIDQPEDDLDNRSLFEDVIQRLWSAKDDCQFLFATHNPNIPVLGDAEQVHACNFDSASQSINVLAGSIDAEMAQKKIIEIMEGGTDAFNRRRTIYEHWKH
jgi:predicted ATPase